MRFFGADNTVVGVYTVPIPGTSSIPNDRRVKVRGEVRWLLWSFLRGELEDDLPDLACQWMSRSYAYFDTAILLDRFITQ